MAFKHYDVVRAASPSDLAERLTQKTEGGLAAVWQSCGYHSLYTDAGHCRRG